MLVGELGRRYGMGDGDEADTLVVAVVVTPLLHTAVASLLPVTTLPE